MIRLRLSWPVFQDHLSGFRTQQVLQFVPPIKRARIQIAFRAGKRPVVKEVPAPYAVGKRATQLLPLVFWRPPEQPAGFAHAARIRYSSYPANNSSPPSPEITALTCRDGKVRKPCTWELPRSRRTVRPGATPDLQWPLSRRDAARVRDGRRQTLLPRVSRTPVRYSPLPQIRWRTSAAVAVWLLAGRRHDGTGVDAATQEGAHGHVGDHVSGRIRPSFSECGRRTIAHPCRDRVEFQSPISFDGEWGPRRFR